MTNWTNNFENGTNGSNVTTGNSGGAGNTPIDSTFGGGIARYDNSVAHGGSLSVETGPNSNTGGAVQWVGGGGVTANLSNFYGRIYIYLSSYPPIGLRLYTAQDASISNYGLQLGAGGGVHNRDVANAVQRGSVSSTVLSLNTWHRIEWHLITSTAANGQSATIYLFTDSNVEGSTPNETIASGNWTGATSVVNLHRFGAVGNGATWTLNIDDIGLSNTALLGPTGTSSTSSGESWGFLPL
jgi:hypothetical protein